MTVVLSGKDVASKIRSELKQHIEEFVKENKFAPGLAVILIGNDPASSSYVRGKTRACEEVGIYSRLINLEVTVSEEELLKHISDLNSDTDIHGILVQLPLPSHINEKNIIMAIDPYKDVDGFHPINIGKMMLGEECFLPCTPFGIIKMLEYANIDMNGKHAVVIGRSNIVGKPIGQLLLNKNATVTYCHSRTVNIKEITKLADILIVAVGKEHFVDETFVKEGAVVIDVGVNRNSEGRLVGDVDFNAIKPKVDLITPVPGGVGPMTITMLLNNTLQAARNHNKYAAIKN
ncbi:MAG: Methylenetetrahydrofolate dehydrogenase [Bacillales bacterium]|jgi:methylenetetrahydrofolate dehydrogenase (NADP+)/methenyltetrahydrofolate cyclohydrolase|nr:Methylenetetrahydrofolate dehydrogenase [Bacillales bacterium]